MKTRWTASTALAALVLSVVSAALLIMAYGVWQDWKLNKQNTLQKTLNLARVCAERQKTFTTNTEILLRTLVNVPVIVQGNTEKVTAFLKKLDVEQPDFVGFSLFRPDGRVIVATINGVEIAVPDPETIRSRQYFSMALQKKGFNIGEYLPAPGTNPPIPSLAMSMPVEDAKGNVIAVMLAPLDFRRYDSLITNLLGESSDGVQIFDRTRMLMYSFHVDSTEMEGSQVQNAHTIEMMNNPQPIVTRECSLPNGKSLMTAMVKLYAKSEDTPYMYVYVQVPLPTLGDFINSRYILEVGAMCAAMLLALGYAWYCGKTFFSNGLEKLSLVARSAQSGNYSMRIGPVKGCQEIHILAEAFDEMLGALENNTALLHYQRACLDFALEGGQMGTWEWDPQTDFCSLDSRGLRILGYATEDLQDTDIRELIHPDDRKLSKSNMRLHLEGALPFYHTDVRLKNSEGRWLWVSLQGRLGSPDLHLSAPRVFGICMDISQRKRIEELEQEKAAYYQRLSNTDALTELNNRRHFMEQAQTALQQASRYGHIVALVMVDIDFFKKVNDTHGHAAGDALLKNFGNLLRHFFRQTDIVGRYGGEEFVFLLQQTTLAEAVATTEKLRLQVEATPVHVDGKTISFTASFGLCACAPTPFSEGGQQRDMQVLLESMIKCADSYLYRAKASGRNCVSYDNMLLDPESLTVG